MTDDYVTTVKRRGTSTAGATFQSTVPFAISHLTHRGSIMLGFKEIAPLIPPPNGAPPPQPTGSQGSQRSREQPATRKGKRRQPGSQSLSMVAPYIKMTPILGDQDAIDPGDVEMDAVPVGIRDEAVQQPTTVCACHLLSIYTGLTF